MHAHVCRPVTVVREDQNVPPRQASLPQASRTAHQSTARTMLHGLDPRPYFRYQWMLPTPDRIAHGSSRWARRQRGGVIRQRSRFGAQHEVPAGKTIPPPPQDTVPWPRIAAYARTSRRF
ncbi:hypothetical protein BC937DRAFT_94029 [Endogone sp. FLAS-F59071]|nr:hypothetical protein BC937DRAFT_94029 [Endogone sp. FLAS-F59071]|eukprot:RUS20922.1 hypothetical protein BC937DRAFT_94029 [Endogone sp. FLAS-F59071]